MCKGRWGGMGLCEGGRQKMAKRKTGLEREKERERERERENERQGEREREREREREMDQSLPMHTWCQQVAIFDDSIWAANLAIHCKTDISDMATHMKNIMYKYRRKKYYKPSLKLSLKSGCDGVSTSQFSSPINCTPNLSLHSQITYESQGVDPPQSPFPFFCIVLFLTSDTAS